MAHQHPYNIPPSPFPVQYWQPNSATRPYYFGTMMGYPVMPMSSPPLFVRSPNPTLSSVHQFNFIPYPPLAPTCVRNTRSETTSLDCSNSYENKETIYRKLTEHLIEYGPCSMSALYHRLSPAAQRVVMQCNSMRDFLLASDNFIIDDVTKFVSLAVFDSSPEASASLHDVVSSTSSSMVWPSPVPDSMMLLAIPGPEVTTSSSNGDVTVLPDTLESKAALDRPVSSLPSPLSAEVANLAVLLSNSSQFAVGKSSSSQSSKLSKNKTKNGGAAKSSDGKKSTLKSPVYNISRKRNLGNVAHTKHSPIPASVVADREAVRKADATRAVSSAVVSTSSSGPAQELSTVTMSSEGVSSKKTISHASVTKLPGSPVAGLSEFCASFSKLSVDVRKSKNEIKAAKDGVLSPSGSKDAGEQNDATRHSTTGDSQLRADAPEFYGSSKLSATATTTRETVAVVHDNVFKRNTASEGNSITIAHKTDTQTTSIGVETSLDSDCVVLSPSTQCCSHYVTSGSCAVRDASKLCDTCRLGHEAAKDVEKRSAALDQLEIDLKATLLMMSLVTTDQNEKQAAMEEGKRVLDVISNQRLQAMLGVTDDALPSMPTSLLRYSCLIKDTGRVLSVLSNPPELAGHGSGTVVKDSSEAGLLLQHQNRPAFVRPYVNVVCSPTPTMSLAGDGLNTASFMQDKSVIAAIPRPSSQLPVLPASNASSLNAQLSGDTDALHLATTRRKLLQQEQLAREEQAKMNEQLLMQQKQFEQARVQQQKQLEEEMVRQQALQQQKLLEQQQKVSAIIQALGGATVVLNNPALLALVKGIVDTLRPASAATQPSSDTSANPALTTNSSGTLYTNSASQAVAADAGQSVPFPSAASASPRQSNPLDALFPSAYSHATAPQTVSNNVFTFPVPQQQQQQQSALANLAALHASNNVPGGLGLSWPNPLNFNFMQQQTQARNALLGSSLSTQNSLGLLQHLLSSQPNTLGPLVPNLLGGLLQNPNQLLQGHVPNPLGLLQPFSQQPARPVVEQTAFDRLLALVGTGGGVVKPSSSATSLPAPLASLLTPTATAAACLDFSSTGGASITSEAIPTLSPKESTSLASGLSEHVSSPHHQCALLAQPPVQKSSRYEDTLDSSGDELVAPMNEASYSAEGKLPFKRNIAELEDNNWDREDDALWTGSSDTWTWLLEECSASERVNTAKVARQEHTSRRPTSLCDDTKSTHLPSDGGKACIRQTASLQQNVAAKTMYERESVVPMNPGRLSENVPTTAAVRRSQSQQSCSRLVNTGEKRLHNDNNNAASTQNQVQWKRNGLPTEFGPGSEVPWPPTTPSFHVKQTGPVALSANIPDHFEFGNLLPPKQSSFQLIDIEMDYNRALKDSRESCGDLSQFSDDSSTRVSNMQAVTSSQKTTSATNGHGGDGEEKNSEDGWQEVKTKKGKLLDRIIGELSVKHPNKTSKQITDALQAVRTKFGGSLNNIPTTKVIHAASKLLADKPLPKKNKAAIDIIPIYSSISEAPPKFEPQRPRKMVMCEFFQAGYCAAGIECVDAHDYRELQHASRVC